MSLNRKQLATAAMMKALQIRQQLGYTLWEPVCVYDLADRLGVEVRFQDIPSMEGVYCGAAKPTIIISSLRPPGRQAFTCGHELGHHALGHGAQFDELVEQRTRARCFEPHEFQADCFASALLMPKSAVTHAFARRGWDPTACAPAAVYVIATWLGVGYTTLAYHMESTLGLLGQRQAKELRRHRPMAIRATLLGRTCRGNLVVADHHWDGRAIDVQGEDFILLPPHSQVEGRCVEVIAQDAPRTLAQAVTPGIGRAVAAGVDWAAYLRVSRQQYVGRSKYRFEEEAEDAE
jgi:Zn-dependent peptidase ImmA (M78 family)